MKVSFGKPMPLYPGAKPCLRCGHCCKVRTCGFGEWDEARHQCSRLVGDKPGEYSCSIYSDIINGKDLSWNMAPAFGAGCCSSLNGDRTELAMALQCQPSRQG